MTKSYQKEVDRLEKKYGLKFVAPTVNLISYPKSGRTWLRMMLAKFMTLGFPDANTEENEIFPALHDDYKSFKKRYGQDFKELSVVFLHRHPGDVAISYFLERRTSIRSGPGYNGTISDYIRSEEHGIKSIIEYNNKWMEKGGNFNQFVSIPYYMLHKNPIISLGFISNMLGIKPSSEKIIETLKEAVEYSSYDNMKKIEAGEGENLLKKYKGNFGVGTGRVNMGKYNNYANLLTEEDIEYVNSCMEKYSAIKYNYDEESEDK